ncbi:unnamed protein product, partial [Meganyctiphanes norvegica]
SPAAAGAAAAAAMSFDIEGSSQGSCLTKCLTKHKTSLTKCGRILKATLCLCLKILDQVTDAATAYAYYHSADVLWFSCSVFFIIVPSIINNIVLCWRFWHLCDERLKINKSILIFLAATQVLTFWSLFMDIVDAFRDDNEKDQLLNKWAKFIRLLESICESFPQTALQSYVICITLMMGKSIASLSIFPDQFPEFPYLSVCLSLVCLCYAFVSFTFIDESGLCQVFFMLLSFLSSG